MLVIEMDCKIIYIVGDGRSGSTLLENVLRNQNNTINVGECFRFWERYYRNETICGCNKLIGNCELWTGVDANLRNTFGDDYDSKKVEQSIKKFTTYKYQKHFNEFEVSEQLKDLIITFYSSIAHISGANIIIDSSKSPGWAILLSRFIPENVLFIHLERELASVADSWKKKVVLPEYVLSQRYMPVKSDLNIIRTWTRVKVMGRRLKETNNYIFLRYEDLVNNFEAVINHVQLKYGLEIFSELKWRGSHSIAGNPVRDQMLGKDIIITDKKSKLERLNKKQVMLFRLWEWGCNLFLR
ncbi:sulfotransferase [Fulvivirga ligni]|uniref:sulfotransferase n=1 Tax=Fulvivirga ligni TaxID=2904246 RepID=UPI001F196D73|nr:sulfotransferase [Fulvivirga ligni]UII23871.1 sulfotransferase [Fulvivirga ligni]